MNTEHLCVRELRLTLEGPVFVGSGITVSKKDCAFDQRAHRVRFYDPLRLQEQIVRRGLATAYEKYMLDPAQRSLYDFFRQNGLAETALKDALLFETSAGDAVGEKGQPADIALFQRGADGKPYLPGSSVKGALHTALLISGLMRHAPAAAKPAMTAAGNEKACENSIRALEQEYFHTLAFDPEHPNNMVNSVFRGILVPDSGPLQAEMVLCRKKDVSPSGYVNTINTIRECLAPGTVISIPITFDNTLSGGISPERVQQAIADFDRSYTQQVLAAFAGQKAAALPRLTQHLFLGGGAGYHTKTVTMPWLGKEEGLQFTARLMRAHFHNGKHENDVRNGVSPHMLKYASVHDRLLPFGLCKAELL